MQIYVHKDNQQLGPFSEAEIKAQLAAGTITLQDHVWWQGQATWLPLGQTSLVAPSATPLPGEPMPGAMTSVATWTTSQLAIWSLVCACGSIICGIFTAVPAIVLGHLALGDIKRNPGRSGPTTGQLVTALQLQACARPCSEIPPGNTVAEAIPSPNSRKK